MYQEDMERRESYINLVDKITSIEVNIARGFTQMQEQHKSYFSTIEGLKEAQEKLTHVLFGNGKEGLITTISKMHDKIGVMWTAICALSVATLIVSAKYLPEIINAVGKVL